MPESTMVRIAVTDPEGVAGRGHVVTLPVHLGRDPGCVEIEVVDRMVSRRHARLEVDGGHVVLTDLGSGNGTWVGAEQISRRVLAPGEQITLGESVVDWTVIPASPVAAPKPDRPAPPPPPRSVGFGTAWGVVLHENRLRTIPLRGLADAWARATRSVAALGAHLAADGATADARLDAHDALNAATDELLDVELSRLASFTFAFCAPDQQLDGFGSRLPRMRRLADHGRARAGVVALRGALGTAEAATVVALVATEDRRLVERLGAALRGGTEAFSIHGAAVVAQAGPDLMGALKEIIVAVVERDRRIANQIRVAGLDGGAAGGPS